MVSSSSLTLLAVEQVFRDTEAFQNRAVAEWREHQRENRCYLDQQHSNMSSRNFLQKMERTVCNMYQSFDFTYEPGEQS